MTDNTYTEVTWVNGVTPVNKANLDQMQTQYKLVAGIQQYDTLPVTPATGENFAIHDGHLYFWNGTGWELAGSAVVSVNGRTGEVLLTSADVGLDNVDNTSDADKPISTAQQTALNGKVDKVTGSSLIPNTKITKLDGIASGAQVNVIEVLKKNGTALTPVSKAVDISVPTALSELTDDATHRLVTDTEKTTWNGKANLVDGKVPASELPSYVDDVIDSYIVGSTPFAADWLSESVGGSALTPAAGKIYIILTAGIYENKEYRWSGTIYVEVSQGVQLGESSSTAYRGDKGKTAYDHSQMTSGNPHNVTKSDVGLGTTVDGAQINVIESVKLNGAALLITSKAVDITVPVVSITTPIINGTAAIGDEGKWADGKHVHPTDTSRAPTSHASTANTYGVGDATNYGHVKVDASPVSGSGNALSSGGGFTALATKQANITTTTGTLTVAGWSAKSQTISITGVTATTKSVRVSYAVASRDAYLASGVHCTAQGAGTLTFACDTTPMAEITVNVELAE